MSACCVSGCSNRHSSSSKLKFYRIPSGSRPFEANRRRLWLQAIQQVNGSTEELRGSARICGAHFKSREASMDHSSPDFVPSVFTCTKQTHKRKVKWFYGRRKRRRRTANVEMKGKLTPPRVDSPVDLQATGESTSPGVNSPVDRQSSALMEETQTTSCPSVPKEREPLTEEAETETETTKVKSQTTPSPNKVSPLLKTPAGIPNLDKRNPIVLLKHVHVPAHGYQCEHCSERFTNVSLLMKHKPLHEEERSLICELCRKLFTTQTDLSEHQCANVPSFPCNMCDRSFPTIHNLKRHKLLHVKDGRKCRTCGVLFCQRHNHVLFLPSTESAIEYEEDDSTSVEPENHLLESSEPSQTADVDKEAQSAMADSPTLPKPGPLPQTCEAPSPASQAKSLSETSAPVFLKPPSVSHLSPPVNRISRNPGTSSQSKTILPKYPAVSVQPLPPQHLELPPSLKLFSPQYLTSALLEVKRNYEYILSKPRAAEK